MRKRTTPRYRWGMGGPDYGWRPWRIGQKLPVTPAAPPPAGPPPAVPAVADAKSKAGTVILVVLGVGVVTFGALELTGVTHILTAAPKPPPPPPTPAAPAAPGK